jgi:hypothetical protein
MSMFGSLKSIAPNVTHKVPLNPSLQHNKKLRKVLSQENFIESLHEDSFHHSNATSTTASHKFN